MLPVTSQVKSIYDDELLHYPRADKADTRLSKHVFIAMTAEVTKTEYSRETSRNGRSMSPTEMEKLLTVGMMKDTYINGKQHFEWQLALNHPTPNKSPIPRKKAFPKCPW